MELTWMGRYRNLVGQLIRYANIYVRGYNIELGGEEGITLSAQSWQVLECIIEHEDETLKMAELSKYLGMPQSTFSKYVKKLVEQNLAERYRKEDNRKEVILRPSEYGRDFYVHKSKGLLELGYKEMFNLLENVPDEALNAMVSAIENLANHLEMDTNEFSKTRLIKLED
ncbi:winged helix DNA-binding protein [uncultured Sphaerochaeta sp.]|uniref:MarR family winged helix-turn-helix transcriptional regulator n=1 Tax=uncultured Sphaerochaeta sp. TaxID=886478 RepID=UPI0029CA27A8|nr:winged helix DNA-binding protein [uncultured Sphaerochaeta sp.]